ncbi:unnamed protein product [Parnassius apollo]|uniref:(apollo) hypothetical protein n=1 Tax=Parnassius apollo TaxID=110799 RepID=A0A8S3WCH4_PARAO|nr:unnamed protein product [Parnassius apollo]
MNTEHESDGDAHHISAQSNTDSEVDADIPSLDSDNNDCRLSELQQADHTEYYKGKDGVTKWQKNPYRLAIRNRAENIIYHLPGVKSVARDKNSPIQCFSLFITEYMIAKNSFAIY